jgi:glycerol kinase
MSSNRQNGVRAIEKYILSLDAGTTSNRAIIFDLQGIPVAAAQRELPQIYPRPGWVEHDPRLIWATMLAASREAMASAGISAIEIAALGLANQRETTLLWERATGKPLCNAIVWQCRRTADRCLQLRNEGLTEFFRKRTGLMPDAYFSATKLEWMLQNIPGAAERAAAGELAFGTVDSWLIWNLTGGCHVTDVSNASRTMLFNIHTLRWDDELLEFFGIPNAVLPEVVPSSGCIGITSAEHLGAPVKIAGVAGDQQAALFGQTRFSPGEVKNTYGTGAFLLMNTGREPVVSRSGLLSTVAWSRDRALSDTLYALEGSVFVAGAVVQWLRDEMGLIATAAESEMLASSVGDTCGCYLVPAFTGLGAPWWDGSARGIITGLTRGVNRRHIVRAALESIAYQVSDVLRAMVADTERELKSLYVDGGAASNNFLLQFQADILGVPVLRPQNIESTALGTAYLAGLGAGVWDGEGALSALARGVTTFEPAMSADRREELISGWHKAVSGALTGSVGSHKTQ